MNVGRLGWTLVAVVLIYPGGGAAGQEGEAGEDGAPADGVVASLGFGTGSNGVGGQLSIWAQLRGHSLGLRTASTFDFQFFGPSDSDEDYAILYGRRSEPGRAWGRVGMGPALVRTVRPGDPIDCFFFCTYETHRSSTVGLALQADGVLALFGPVGLGATVFGNVNPISSFGGITVNVVIGRVGS